MLGCYTMHHGRKRLHCRGGTHPHMPGALAMARHILGSAPFDALLHSGGLPRVIPFIDYARVKC